MAVSAQQVARFARLFQAEHAALTRELRDLPEPGREWRATILLTRLMVEALQHAHDPAYPPPGACISALPAGARRRLRGFVAGQRWSLADTGEPGVITPSLLGPLLERQINQKEIGAYYTQDDISDYIARSTIIPCLLARLGAYAPALQLGARIQRAIRDHPTHYIPAERIHGCALALPAAVASGAGDPAARDAWDARSPRAYGLPGELWRAAIARRAHASEQRALLQREPPGDPADLVAHNLDLEQLALDLIGQLSAEEARACWECLGQLRILDPTCGSGAFLLAAIRVLAPLYRACQRQMSPAQTPDELQLHAAIIAQNLHGVDLIPEAVEICRARCALLLLSHTPVGAPPAACAPHLVAADALAPGTWAEHFGAIGAAGGFDLVIGNPPYLAARGSDPAYQHLETRACGNLYAYVVEQSLRLLRPGGWCGMIVPIASVATRGMEPLQALYRAYDQWHSHYAVRPGKLFPGVDMNLTISLLHAAPRPTRRYTTGYRRWSDRTPNERATIFPTLRYIADPLRPNLASPHPKLGAAVEQAILDRMIAHGRRLRDYVSEHGTTIYYHSGGRYWRKALLTRRSSHFKPITVPTEIAPLVFGLLNSQLFYWYWIANSNCMDVVSREVLDLPVFALEQADPAPYTQAMRDLLTSYALNQMTRHRRGARIRTSEVSIDMASARPLIDAIDRLLAHDYQLDAEQLDFVRSYDLQYRTRP